MKEWMEELRRIQWLLSGRVEGPDLDGDFERYDPGIKAEDWRDYYEQGMTPAQALMEDFAYA